MVFRPTRYRLLAAAGSRFGARGSTVNALSFDQSGALDKRTLLANLNKNQIENRVSFLSQALNELLFFEMFAAREWLEREEQQELQKIINQLFIEIG